MTYVGLIVAIVGGGIVQSGDISLNSANLFGNSIALLSALFLAITFVLAEEIRQETNSIIYGRSLFFVASITVLLIATTAGDSILDFKAGDIPWFLFLGLVPSIFWTQFVELCCEIYNTNRCVVRAPGRANNSIFIWVIIVWGGYSHWCYFGWASRFDRCLYHYK